MDEFLRPFHVHFQRSEGRQSLERHLTGLLTEYPNKNCDTLAQVVPATNQQRLHNLPTGVAFDEDDLNDQRVRTLTQLPSEGDAVLIFDDTGFAKQGRCSVGVQRQYSGTLGKTGNCQVTVNCHYAERTLAWPVAARLYLPKEWACDRARREKAQAPEDIEFRTKPEIALALLDHARELGIRHAAVTADGGLVHDAISRTKREIAVLHGKSFDYEMAKVNGELGAVVGGTEQATQQVPGKPPKPSTTPPARCPR